MAEIRTREVIQHPQHQLEHSDQAKLVAKKLTNLDLKQAMWEFDRRYGLKQHVVVSGNGWSDTDAKQCAWFQLILGLDPKTIGKQRFSDLVSWFTSPQRLFVKSPAALYRHKVQLAHVREKRPPVWPKGGVVTWTNSDGSKVKVPGWTYPALYLAKSQGVHFYVSSGYRSIAEQWYLYLHPEGYPVAYPGSSHHNGYKYPDGAVDLSSGAGDFAHWLRSHPSAARGLEWAGDKDAVHFSVPGSHHSGEGDY